MARCSNCQSGLVSGDENNRNGVNEIMEHRLRSHAITSLYVFIYLFRDINFKQSESRFKLRFYY